MEYYRHILIEILGPPPLTYIQGCIFTPMVEYMNSCNENESEMICSLGQLILQCRAPFEYRLRPAARNHPFTKYKLNYPNHREKGEYDCSKLRVFQMGNYAYSKLTLVHARGH